MLVSQCLPYPVIVASFLWLAVSCVQIDNEGLADFSDEHKDAEIIQYNDTGITSINTTSLNHLAALRQFNIPHNDLKAFPDFTAVADSLEALSFQFNPFLSNPGNLELAVLRHLKGMLLYGTNIKLLTSTCPEDSDVGYFINGDKLDLCDCQHAWLKVSYCDI